MKNLKAVCTILIAILMLSTTTVFLNVKADAHPAISMWIEPSSVSLNTATHSVGYTFDLVVWANTSTTNASAWQFQMLYPSAYLRATACVYTGTGGTRSQWFEDNGVTNLMALMPTIDAFYDGTRNYVLHGEAWSPMVPSNPFATDAGTLSRVTFEVIAAPPKGDSIVDLIDIKTLCTPPSGKTYILDQTGNEMLPNANVFNCAYTYVWSTPPSPFLGVSPDTIDLAAEVDHVGELVDVDIFIYSLSAAWYLVNASFRLNFDDALVGVDSVAIDAAWDVTASYTVGTNYIDFFVETSGTLSGSVKVADITFEILYQGDYPDVDICDLTLTDIYLSDHDIEVPTGAPVDGQIIINGFLVLPPPYLQVSPASTTLGPAPSIGTEFDVDIIMKQQDPIWRCVGYSFRLGYDDTLLEVVSITEGPFLSTTSWGWAYLLGTNETTDLTIPAAAAPLWVSLIRTLVKVEIVMPATYTFAITMPTGILMFVDGSGPTTSFTASATKTVELEFRNYGLVPVTGKYSIKCTPNTWQVDLYGTDANVTDPGSLVAIDWIRNTDAPPFTWFFSNVLPDGVFGPHAAVGGLITTNTGEWFIFPSGEGVVATIRFKAIKQQYVDLTCDLDLFDIIMVNDIGGDIPLSPEVDGTYTMLGFDLPGRQIDLYTQYPSPYGGQGPDAPSDMFWPQKEVILYAYVSYNYWPVQQKLVSYEIADGNGHVWDKKTAITNEDGIAEVRFRMPWPCDDPESLFGVWTVTSTVDIACEVITDTLEFHYDYLVNIVKVTTDAPEYAHGDTVSISIEVTSHAQQEYSVLVTAAIVDELGYTIGFASAEITIGGAEFCTPASYEVTLTIPIPKYAAAGLATVHVNCFDKEPVDGGVALCPEFTPPPEIFIWPY